MKVNIITSIFVIIVLLLVLYVMIPVQMGRNQASPLQISLEEARSRRFGLILDVRTPEQRSRLGYYPNSIPMSLEKLDQQVPLDISNKRTWILVYSNGDDRDNKAEYASTRLFEKGYPNVRFISESYLRLLPGSQ
jgi:rhodanese-related sulfurtransferase